MKKLILILGLVLPMLSANASELDLTEASLIALEQSPEFQMAKTRMSLMNAADEEGGITQEGFQIKIGGKVYYTNDWASFSSCLKGLGTIGTCGGAFIAAEVSTLGAATVAIGAFLVCSSTAMDNLRYCISK